MPVAHKLAGAREPFDRIALPGSVITRDVVETFAVQHKVAAVDPALTGGWFLIKLANVVPTESDAAEASRGVNRGDCRQFAMCLMEFDQ